MVTHTLGGAAIILAALAPLPLMAQTAADPPNASAIDIALQPLADMNLRHHHAPESLKAASDNPYALDGLISCEAIAKQVALLDQALGSDIDTAQDKSAWRKATNGAGRIARALVDSFIPFRALVRELSGATASEHRWDRELYAGAVRRAYLKGVGEERGCDWPARDATPEVAVLVRAARKTDAETARLAESSPSPVAQPPSLVQAQQTWLLPPP